MEDKIHELRSVGQPRRGGYFRRVQKLEVKVAEQVERHIKIWMLGKPPSGAILRARIMDYIETLVDDFPLAGDRLYSETMR